MDDYLPKLLRTVVILELSIEAKQKMKYLSFCRRMKEVGFDFEFVWRRHISD